MFFEKLLTVDELAEALNLSRRQIYTMCESRTRNGSMKDHPIPFLRINGNLRFQPSAIQEWLRGLEQSRALETCVIAQDQLASTPIGV